MTTAMSWTVLPQNWCVEISTSNTSECDFFWGGNGSNITSSIKKRPLGWALIQYNRCCHKRGKCGYGDKDSHREMATWRWRWTSGWHVCKPRTGRDCQAPPEAGERPKQILLRGLRGDEHCQHRDFRLLGWKLWEYKSSLFKLPGKQA